MDNNNQLREHYRYLMRDLFNRQRYEYLNQLIQQVLEMGILIVYEFNTEPNLTSHRDFILYLVERGAEYFYSNNRTYLTFNMPNPYYMENITNEVYVWNEL